MNTMTLPISSFPDEKQADKMTIPEFLAYLERYPNQRVELINGQIIERKGVTSNHSAIAMNCLDVKFFLRQYKPYCHVCNNDFGIQTKENQVRYPLIFQLFVILKAATKSPIIRLWWAKFYRKKAPPCLTKPKNWRNTKTCIPFKKFS